MARQPRYEDYVSYDADPVEEEADERFDPNSGRPWSEIAAQRREAHRQAVVEKTAMTLNFGCAA